MAEAIVSRLTVLEKGLTIVAAVLALGTGFLGYKSATISQARDQAQAAVTDTNTETSALRAKNDELVAENARLRAQLGLPGPAPDPQVSMPGATVRRSGQLVLASNRYADLDSPQSDPQWDDGDSDIYYYQSAVSLWSGTGLYLGDKKADYETCRNTTDDLGSVVGAYFCVKTSEGRYSALRITQLDSSKVTLDVVTYDPPDN